jgi:hypothetical protein
LLFGYLEFALLLFLPGLATLLVFNQIRESSIVTALARSYGISLALNAIVVFAGLVLARSPVVRSPSAATGTPISDLPSIILAVSAVLILLLGAFRYRSELAMVKSIRISKERIVVLLLAVVSAALILSEFVKYPNFPKSYSVDFVQHVYLLRDVVSLQVGPAAGILYYGVHYNLALGYVLVGGDTVIQIQYLMGILAAPASLLVYEAGRRIYSSEKHAILAQLLFIATGFLWYVPLYDTGLYPNLFAIILSFAFIIELRNTVDGSSKGRFVVFAIVAIGLYLSHYFSPVLVIAALISLFVAVGLRHVNWRSLVIPLVVTLAPLGALVFRPELVRLAQAVYTQSGATGAFAYSTPLSDIFSFNPFLRYTVAIVFNYGSIVILFGLPFAIFHAWRQRSEAWPLVTLIIWFLLLWILSPSAELAWRFAFQGLAALLLLTPATFSVAPRFVKWILGIGPGGRRKQRRVREGDHSVSDMVIVAVMLLIVFVGSWTTFMVEDLASDSAPYSAAQSDLYDSMTWFAQNSPPQSSLLSVTDWRVAFLNPIAGRTGQLLLLAPGRDAANYARNKSYGYILVTYHIPAEVPPSLDLVAYFNSFNQTQSLRVVYQNQNDIIYQVLK